MGGKDAGCNELVPFKDSLDELGFKNLLAKLHGNKSGNLTESPFHHMVVKLLWQIFVRTVFVFIHIKLDT